MVTSAQCYKKYGDPTLPSTQSKWFTIWDVPTELEIGFIPKRVYCNKDLIQPLELAFRNLITTGHYKEIKTWDGCWNIRKMRGLKSMSLHSWAIAVDINASHNRLGMTFGELKKVGCIPLSDGFLQCFRDVGFECGGDWKTRPDRMHFQLATI